MTVGPLTDFLPAKTDIIAVWILGWSNTFSLDLSRHFITGNVDYGLVGLNNGFELYFYYELNVIGLDWFWTSDHVFLVELYCIYRLFVWTQFSNIKYGKMSCNVWWSIIKMSKHAKPWFQIHPTLVTTWVLGVSYSLLFPCSTNFLPAKTAPPPPPQLHHYYGLNPTPGTNIFRVTVASSVSFQHYL